MTRKEQALENLFNAYKLIGYADNTAQHRIHDYRNSRISDIEMETERVIKFHKKNDAELYKKDEFFANSNRMDEIDAWIKNPLNAEELGRR